jgi:serine/threonine-protein kinase RsbW
MARPKRRVFPGCHQQVAHARRFVMRALDDCPATDEAVLCVSELAANAVLHTASGKGGAFEVIVQRGESSVRITVRDDGSHQTPAARTLDAISEDGRGLGMVALVADQWGQSGGENGRTIWFEIRWRPARSRSCAERSLFAELDTA